MPVFPNAISMIHLFLDQPSKERSNADSARALSQLMQISGEHTFNRLRNATEQK